MSSNISGSGSGSSARSSTEINLMYVISVFDATLITSSLNGVENGMDARGLTKQARRHAIIYLFLPATSIH